MVYVRTGPAGGQPVDAGAQATKPLPPCRPCIKRVWLMGQQQFGRLLRLALAGSRPLPVDLVVCRILYRNGSGTVEFNGNGKSVGERYVSFILHLQALTVETLPSRLRIGSLSLRRLLPKPVSASVI